MLHCNRNCAMQHPAAPAVSIGKILGTQAMDQIASNMNELHGYYFEDLEVGMTDIFGKTLGEADITMFAGISGDINWIKRSFGPCRRKKCQRAGIQRTCKGVGNSAVAIVDIKNRI